MDKQKGFALILILVGILVLAGIVGGAYFLGKSNKTEPVKVVSTPQVTAHPTSQPTSVPQASASGDMTNWKTYTNSKYNFSIQYPPTFIVEDRSTQSPAFIIFSDTARKITGEGGIQENPYIDITVFPTQSSLSDYIANPQNNLQQTRSTTINGNIFAKVEEVHGIGGAATNEYATQVKNAVLIFNDPFLQIDVTTFNQILSTFRFTN